MNRFGLWQALICVALFSLPAFAVDLTQVDRRIAKEPAYQAKDPKYGLLVFGPEAKHRVWLVLDGDDLYVDKNGNGDLTEADERIHAPAFKALAGLAREKIRSIDVGSITVGGLTHTDMTVSQMQYRRRIGVSGLGELNDRKLQDALDAIWRQVPSGLVYTVSIQMDPKCYEQFGDPEGRRVLQSTRLDPHCRLSFAERSENAPILHFGGPLTLRDASSGILSRGDKSATISLSLGTPGFGLGTLVNVVLDFVPKDAQPTIELEFAARDSSKEPLTRKYVLNPCPMDGWYLFEGPVRVPDEAGLGPAKMTMFFGAWSEGKVAPATVEILVEDPRATGKDAKPEDN